MHGSMSVIDRGDLRLHSYMAPDQSLNVTTQLLETPARILVVDGQYALAMAEEVAAYARGLGKPVDRVVVTHAHPDHFHGAGRFGAPIHALRAVRDQIAAQGEGQDPSGVAIPNWQMLPTVLVEPGEELIDGIRFVFDAVVGGEAADQLVIRLPDHGVLVAQDLVYHRTHLFMGNDDVEGWRRAIAELGADESIEVVLAGHGKPAGREVFAELDGYLVDAGELLPRGPEDYKAAMLSRHPSWGGQALIDIGNGYLFPER